MRCDWCDEPVLDMMPQVKSGPHIYHMECIIEFKRLQDESYERKKYLEEKWGDPRYER